MKKGMNFYVAGIMLAIIVAAAIVLYYVNSKQAFNNSINLLDTLKNILGV